MEYSSYNFRPRRKVLIVDDEAINRQLLGLIVSQQYEVIYAENGQEALDICREKGGSLSLVMLDILMPVMTGMEFLKIRQNDKQLRRIPVIILTSEADAEVECLNQGAVDFIKKPYNHPDVIMARVNRIVELSDDRELIRAVQQDELTGLFNKEFFYEYIRQNDRLEEGKKHDAAVINIEHFHLVNALHGMAFGDTVLKEVAAIIRRLAEETGGIVCRCEADQFYLYCDHHEDNPQRFAEALRQLPLELEDARIRVRIGIYPDCDTSIKIEERIDRANVACTSLRNKYNRSIAFYDQKMQETEVFHEQLVRDMQEAIDTRQFIVYYQPKYNVEGECPKLSSAEALIRWIHPEHGFLSPGVFIPLFERNGLIQKLDDFVWREAAAQCRIWKEAHGLSIPVSVNVSRMDFYDPKLIETLKEIRNENGLQEEELHLEVTESAYSEDTKQLIEVITALQKEGFAIEMDDFGVGYSSLSMLTQMPIDVLKLDMKFLRQAADNEVGIRMIEMMIRIAEQLGVPVIAEGVEEEAQVKMLKEMGCQTLQGYYFSKPVPAAEFEKLIEKEKEGC